MPQDRNISFEGRSQDPPPNVFRNHLFVIGIDSYLHIPKLENAVEDASDFVDTLTSHYQFEHQNLVFLKNETANFRKIKDTFRKYAETLGEKDNLVIFFSGHGLYDKVLDQGYWIPVDAEENSTAYYISNSDISTYLRAIKCFHTLLISDSCFSGTLFARTRDFSRRVEKVPSRWGLASGRDEPVSDGGSSGNSPFTENLLYFLRQNAEPSLLISELIQSVKQAVANNSRQTPIGSPLQDVGDKGGEFVFHRKTKPIENLKEVISEMAIPRDNPAPTFPENIHTIPEIEKVQISPMPEFTVSENKSEGISIKGFSGEIRAVAGFENRFLVSDKSGSVTAFNYKGKLLSRTQTSHDLIEFEPGGQRMLVADLVNRTVKLLGTGGTTFQTWEEKKDEEKGIIKIAFAQNAKFLVLINSKLYINGKECRFNPGTVVQDFFLQSPFQNVSPNSIWIEEDKPVEICDAGFFVLAENNINISTMFYFVTWNHIKAGSMEIPVNPEQNFTIEKVEFSGPYVQFRMSNGELFGHRYEAGTQFYRGMESALENPENGPVWKACGGYYIIGNPAHNPEGSAFRNIWLDETEDAGKLMAFEYFSTRQESFFLALFENGNLWTGSLDKITPLKNPAFKMGMKIDTIFVRNVNESILLSCADLEGNIQLIDFQNFREPKIVVEKFRSGNGRVLKMDIFRRERIIFCKDNESVNIQDFPEGMKVVNG